MNKQKSKRRLHREKGWQIRSAELSDRLKYWRKRNKLSQNAAALQLGMSPRTLQEWEQGRAIPHDIAVKALPMLMASLPRRRRQ